MTRSTRIGSTVAAALFLLCGAAQLAKADASADAKAIIWAKELKIYKDRASGSIQYYESNVTPDYLGWPPIADRPFRNDGLHKTAPRVAGKQEHIENNFVDFTMNGDTAVIYYINHRTSMGDGTPVDQSFANIHVWVKRDGDWRLLGGMAREMAPGAH